MLITQSKRTHDAGVTQKVTDPFSSISLLQVSGVNDVILAGRPVSSHAIRPISRTISDAGVTRVAFARSVSKAYAN